MGDDAELLAEFILGTMAFCTKVPREKDVGHDLMCVLYEQEGKFLRTGPSFTVQVKSDSKPLVYKKKHEIAWLSHQEAPFFIALVDRKELIMKLYSTWNMRNWFLKNGAQETRLLPGKPIEKSPSLGMSRGVMNIPLGKAILRVSAADATKPNRVKKLAAVLEKWVLLDRNNQVFNEAGMFWVTGPARYRTNVSPVAASMKPRFFWNPNNLVQCEFNFGLVATALRLVLRAKHGIKGESESVTNGRVANLEHTLRTFAYCLNPLAKKALREEIGLKV